VTIEEINSIYITEINRTISEIDTTTINKAINSTGGEKIMIICLIFMAIALLMGIRLAIIILMNGFGKKIFTIPAICASTAITFIIITGLMELKFMDYGPSILGIE
jgi:hypothetical protein